MRRDLNQLARFLRILFGSLLSANRYFVFGLALRTVVVSRPLFIQHFESLHYVVTGRHADGNEDRHLRPQVRHLFYIQLLEHLSAASSLLHSNGGKAKNFLALFSICSSI